MLKSRQFPRAARSALVAAARLRLGLTQAELGHQQGDSEVSLESLLALAALEAGIVPERKLRRSQLAKEDHAETNGGAKLLNNPA